MLNDIGELKKSFQEILSQESGLKGRSASRKLVQVETLQRQLWKEEIRGGSLPKLQQFPSTKKGVQKKKKRTHQPFQKALGTLRISTLD